MSFEITPEKAKSIVDKVPIGKIGKELYNLLTIYGVDGDFRDDQDLKQRIETIINSQQELIKIFSGVIDVHTTNTKTFEKTKQEVELEVRQWLDYLTRRCNYKEGDNIVLYKKKFKDSQEFLSYITQDMNLSMGFMGSILTWIQDEKYMYEVLHCIENIKSPRVKVFVRVKRKVLTKPLENSRSTSDVWLYIRNLYRQTGLDIWQMTEISKDDALDWLDRHPK